MRRLKIGFFLSGVMTASAAIAQAAQPTATEPSAVGATRSVADYLCAFAGKCDADTSTDETGEATADATSEIMPEMTKPAPETRGFSLARPTAATTTQAARPATPRGPQRIVTTRVAPPAVTSPPRRRTRLAARPRTPVAPSVAVPAPVRFSYAGAPPSVMAPRVDLMLTFKKNSAEMTAQAREEAAVFAQSLLAPELRAKRFTIEGHTDSAGGRAYNLALSQRRAKAVAAFLASKGVESSRLQVRGMAFDAPRAGQAPESPDNRRVEAVLTS